MDLQQKGLYRDRQIERRRGNAHDPRNRCRCGRLCKRRSELRNLYVAGRVRTGSECCEGERHPTANSRNFDDSSKLRQGRRQNSAATREADGSAERTRRRSARLREFRYRGIRTRRSSFVKQCGFSASTAGPESPVTASLIAMAPIAFLFAVAPFVQNHPILWPTASKVSTAVLFKLFVSLSLRPLPLRVCFTQR